MKSVDFMKWKDLETLFERLNLMQLYQALIYTNPSKVRNTCDEINDTPALMCLSCMGHCLRCAVHHAMGQLMRFGAPRCHWQHFH